MANETLQQVAEQLKGADAQIEEAEELIAVMREAGENVAQLEGELRALKQRKQKWELTLQKRGYNVKG